MRHLKSLIAAAAVVGFLFAGAAFAQNKQVATAAGITSPFVGKWVLDPTGTEVVTIASKADGTLQFSVGCQSMERMLSMEGPVLVSRSQWVTVEYHLLDGGKIDEKVYNAARTRLRTEVTLKRAQPSACKGGAS